MKVINHMHFNIPSAMLPQKDMVYVNTGITCNTEDKLMTITADADVVLISTRPPPHLTRRVIENMKHCRLIHVSATGYEVVDVMAATENGICVTNGGDYAAEEVSDHVMALLFACARKISRVDNAMKHGKYAQIRGFLPTIYPLRSQTLGIVGLGRIGSQVAIKASGFGLKVISYDKYIPDEDYRKAGATKVSLDELLTKADFVSLNIPLTDETRNMIGLAQLKKMKKTAYLINTARGEIVNEEALLEVLKSSAIAGAGIDVVTVEPILPDNPLISLENVVITPHLGYYSEQSGLKLMQKAGEHLNQVIEQKWPTWLVNPEVKELYQRKYGKMR